MDRGPPGLVQWTMGKSIPEPQRDLHLVLQQELRSVLVDQPCGCWSCCVSKYDNVRIIADALFGWLGG
jgi:hypothetical protein